MKAGCVLLLLVLTSQCIWSQTEAITPETFFAGDDVLQVSVTTDIKMLRNNKDKPVWQPATFSVMYNGQTITEEIRVQMRGNIRKRICDVATLQMDFANPSSPKLFNLHKLKWVGGCRFNGFDEELLQREYLVYKLYNQLTPLSFRVRLLKVTYNDSRSRIKPYEQNAFLIESTKDVGARNNMQEKKTGVFQTQAVDRMQVTLVSIFEYMIGNTDFSIPSRHNVKLMVPTSDTSAKPQVIPYDFDYAGIVDAPYAIPREELEISSVRVRMYRGFRRTEQEVDSIVGIFKAKRDAFLKVLNDFTLINPKAKADMLQYVNSFYTLIEKDHSVRRVFVTNARTF